MSLFDICAQVTNIPGSLEGRGPLIQLARFETESNRRGSDCDLWVGLFQPMLHTTSTAPKACSVNVHNVQGSCSQSGRATCREVRVGHNR